MSIHTHYDNLQVSRNASDSVIRAAYKSLIQKHHPDKNPECREEAERITGIIREAFEVLADKQRRLEHDVWIIATEDTSHPTNLKTSLADTDQTAKAKHNGETSQTNSDVSNWIYAIPIIIVVLLFASLGGKKEEAAAPESTSPSIQISPDDFIYGLKKNSDKAGPHVCLAEKIRIDAIEGILNTSSKQEMIDFTKMNELYKERCQFTMQWGLNGYDRLQVDEYKTEITKIARSEWVRKSLSLH